MACTAAPSQALAPLPLPSPRRPRRPSAHLSLGRGRRVAAFAVASGPEGVAEEEEEDGEGDYYYSSPIPGSSTQNQLDLLEQLVSANNSQNAYMSNGTSRQYTIREQLSELVGDAVGEFTIPLGKKMKASLNSLTISQKRNIKRQAYLNEVSRRNDSVFFATIGAFVILPPLVILAISVAMGYVKLLP